MKTVNSKIYNEKYYTEVCLGSSEFKKSSGKKLNKNLETILNKIPLGKTMKILDVGCGRGDITLFLAKRVSNAIGIDYSKDAIRIAKGIKGKFSSKIQKKIEFKVMNVKHLDFKNDYFDAIICIDVLEHLYKEEAEQAMHEISRVLKKNGLLFIHTGANRLLYDFTYPLYVYPMNKFLTTIDQFIKGEKYPGLPKDPRTEAEKIQHVNEPTYFYLKKLFKKYSFGGTIDIKIGFIKEVTGIRTIMYNGITLLYPLSAVFPLNILFGSVFSATLINKKK